MSKISGKLSTKICAIFLSLVPVTVQAQNPDSDSGLRDTTHEAINEASASRYQAAYRSYIQHADAKNFEAALPHAQEAYLLGKSIHGENSEDFAKLTYNFGLSLLEVGAAAQAYPLLQNALVLYEGLFGRKAFQLTTLLAHLATAAVRSGDPNLAIQHFDRALAVVALHQEEGSLAVATLALHAGIALAEQDHDALARPYLLSSYIIHQNTVGADDRSTALAALHLGLAYLEHADYAPAVRYLEGALKGFELGVDADREYALMAHTALITAYETQGRSEAATRHLLAVGADLPEVYADGYRPLFQPPPTYPVEALHAGSRGTVLLEFDVDEEGFVRELEAIAVEGDDIFVEPALEAARRYRFAPRFMQGRPVKQERVQARLFFAPPETG